MNRKMVNIPRNKNTQFLIDSAGEIPSIESNPSLQYLYDNGFLVDSELDEKMLGDMYYYDNIYENDLNITVLVSEDCNFRCKYCYESFKNGDITTGICESFLKFLQKNLHKYKSLTISWFGGEPLLNIKAIEMISKKAIELCRSLGVLYSASISTNGYLLTPEMTNRLIACKVLNIQVTLDGTEKAHDELRVLRNGDPTFDIILNNLKNIRDNVKRRSVKFRIRSNLSKIQMDEISDYLVLMNKEFSADSRFQFYFRPVGDWGGQRVKSVKDKIFSTLNELYEPILKCDVILNSDFYLSLLPLNICNAAKRHSFVLGSNGTIYKCTMLLDDDCNKIGYLRENGILELDLGKLSKWVIGSSYSSSESKCNKCNLWNLCHSHQCPATSVLHKSPSCGYEVCSIDFVLKLVDRSQNDRIEF